MTLNDTDYYRARANEERERALAAGQNVAAIHLELARLYDALVNEPAIRPTLRIITPVSKATG